MDFGRSFRENIKKNIATLVERAADLEKTYNDKARSNHDIVYAASRLRCVASSILEQGRQYQNELGDRAMREVD